VGALKKTSQIKRNSLGLWSFVEAYRLKIAKIQEKSQKLKKLLPAFNVKGE
jgi:hypothetical protein